MKNLFRINGLLLVAWLAALTLNAQEKVNPEMSIGSPCPEVTFKDIKHYSKKNVSLDEFSGKWLILDFWNVECKSCLIGFKKIDELNREFGNNIQFMLVSTNAKAQYGYASGVYERIAAKQKLNLPVVYDSGLFAKFNIPAVPFIVIIDPHGTLFTRTIAPKLTSENLSLMLKAGNPFGVWKSQDELNAPVITKTDEEQNGEYVFQSQLSKWKPGTAIDINLRINRNVTKCYYKTTATSRNRLYNVAYWGKSDWDPEDSLYAKVWPNPIVPLEDSLLFTLDTEVNGGNFNYYLGVPKEKASESFFLRVMQNDMQNYFAYQGHIETRPMPCWELRQMKDKPVLIHTKGGVRKNLKSPVGLRVINQGVIRIIKVLSANCIHDFPIVDRTGIQGNIDILFDAILTDKEDMERVLNKNNLELVQSTKEMKVLVLNYPVQ